MLLHLQRLMAPCPPSTNPTLLNSPCHHPPAGAATRSYNLAEEWDKTTGLTDDDIEALEALKQACGQRPYPLHLLTGNQSPHSNSLRGAAVINGSGDAEAGGGAEQADGEGDESLPAVTSLDEQVLQNAHQFYLWHGEMEAARTSETEEKYRRYGEVLVGHLGTCGQLLSQVDATLRFFDQLQEQVSPSAPPALSALALFISLAVPLDLALPTIPSACRAIAVNLPLPTHAHPGQVPFTALHRSTLHVPPQSLLIHRSPSSFASFFRLPRSLDFDAFPCVAVLPHFLSGLSEAPLRRPLSLARSCLLRLPCCPGAPSNALPGAPSPPPRPASPKHQVLTLTFCLLFSTKTST